MSKAKESVSVVWSVDSMEWDTATGGVSTVHWRATLVDGEYSASSYGSIGFAADPDSDGFVPLGDLSPEIVVGWVRGHESVADVESGLFGQVAKAKKPVSQSGLPWLEG